MNTPPGFRKTPSGRFEYRFTFDKVRYSIVCDDVPEGLARQKEMILELSKNGYVPNKKVKFQQYYDEFIEKWRYSVKSSTVNIMQSNASKFLPVLGEYKVREIETRQLQKFYDALINDGVYSVTTANLCMTKLSMIFKEAIHDRIITENPMDGVKTRKSKNKARSTVHRALTVQEQELFEEKIVGLWLEHYLMFMLHSGVRCGEASALRWSDVDLEKSVIHIQRTLTRSEKGVTMIGDSPKSESSKRDLPMTETLREILLKQKERTLAVNGFIEEEGLVFPGYVKEFVMHQSVNWAIRGVLRQMPGVKPFTSHALRDTFATRFIEAGGNPKTLQMLLGHSTFSMTMDVYARVLPNTKLNELEQMEQAMQEKKNQRKERKHDRD